MGAVAGDVRVVGTLAAANDTVRVSQPGTAVVTAQLTGTFVGTVVFEVDNDEGASPNWVAVNAQNVNTAAAVSSATAPGIFKIDAAGLRQVRVRCSAYTSGSIAVTLNASVAAAAPGLSLASSGGTVAGDVASGTADSGNPVKIGEVAVAHGANPTAVAAGARVNLNANRHGVPFVMGGHPNVQTIRVNYTTAQTDTAIITIATGLKIVVTGFLVTADAANSVNTTVRIGFGAVNTPTGAGVIGSHPGVAPGSGFGRGGGAGIIGVGADDADLRITSSVPTSGSIDVDVSYYTIES